MLVSKFMQILSNLFGLNKKINASDVAIKKNNKGVTLDNYLNNLNEYSTDEQVIGKWIDGKPIYRKVINTTKSQVSDIMTNLHIKRLISTVGSYATSIYSNSWPIPSYYVEEPQYDIGLMGGAIPGENVSITFGSYYNDDSAVILVLEYTKTTD